MRIEPYLLQRCRPLTVMAFASACFAVWGIASPAVGAENPNPAGSFEIPAWTFDRGNAKVCANPYIYADYRDKFPELVVGDGGQLPWVVEYDVEFPVDATYALHVRYGSPEKRPMDVWLDGKKIGTCCGRMTGNAPPYPDRHPQHNRPRDAEGFHGVEWEEACKLPATKGKHALKFTRQGLPPRLSVLRLESPVAFPKDWKPAERKVPFDSIEPALHRIFLPRGSVSVAALRVAIEDVIAEYGPGYPKGPEYLKQLAGLDEKQKAAQGGTPEQKQPIEDALKSLQRDAMLAHPEMKFDKLLFVTQIHEAVSIYTGHLRNGKPGGNLCVLSPVSPDGKVTKLVPELDGGVFGRFDLSFDATKVVFCYAKNGGSYRIYEIDIDPKTGLRAGGNSLRQITVDGADEAETIQRYKGTNCGRGYDDMDPCYMPNGKIMFSSTRAQRAVLCAPVTASTLFVMDGDGKNMRCISAGQVNELAPCLLDDGRVAYTRWEYVDKGFGNAQSLWAVRPDGSGSDHIYKNTVVRPGAMIHVRSIPGSRKIVTVGVGHHGGLAGPVLLIDSGKSRTTGEGMTNITPEIDMPGLFPMSANGCWFREPHPFSEKFFLVSHNATVGKEPFSGIFGIYMLDAWGNRAELYQNPEFSSFQPTPLRPRLRPVNIPPVGGTDETVALTDKTKEGMLATMFIQDIYRGMTGIERGRVKYVRVMEAMTLSWLDGWRSGKQEDGGPGMQASAVSYGADPAIKKIHGIATVHEDGSAFFTVPPNKNLFFQALDENYMELQRMRTFINLMPGENRSCIGCHEPRTSAPRLQVGRPKAMNSPTETLRPQPGDTGPRSVHYALDIQPIFDKHCINCHGGQQPKAELDLTRELTEKFSRSYETFFKKQLVSYLEGGFGSANIPAEPPLTFGSHQSKLVERIRKDPCKANLTREEFIKIVTWIDANTPYYGTHEGKKNLKWKDDPDFRPLPLAGK